MPKPTRLWQLRCSICGHTAICANADMVSRLRAIGMLKREKMPDPELLDALLPTAAPRLPCDNCQALGLQVELFEDEWDDDVGGRSCESCGTAIPRERLQLLPETRLCAACQQTRESEGDPDEPEFCPRCGGLMRMRQSSQGGLTRYVWWCSSCGK